MKFEFQVRYAFDGHKVGDVVDWDKVEEPFRSHNFGVKVLVQNKVVKPIAPKSTNGLKAATETAPSISEGET